MDVTRFKGCLLGLAIGDSLGASREGSLDISENRILSPRYTDDTAMMIGVAESLVQCKGFDGEEMSNTLIQNYLREPWRGYGSGPPKIFRMILEEKKRWDEMLDRKIYVGGSFGNGAAMRIAPVGLIYGQKPEKLREIVYKVSIITHSHELAIEGAILLAYSVFLASTSMIPIDKDQLLDKLKTITKNKIYLQKLDLIHSLWKNHASKKEVIQYLGNGIEAINSVPTAIYSFIVKESFEDSVIYAVSLGGDADTIGAMAGALAGAYYGYESIPKEWLHQLENNEYIETLAFNLFHIFCSSC